MNHIPVSIESDFIATGPHIRQRPWGRWGLRAIAILYLGVMIVLPISSLLEHGLRDGLGPVWRDVTNPIALSALQLTLGTAIAMTIINTVIGTLTAYVLVRYRFFGSGFLNSLVDLPFAVPTLVTGVMLVVLYGPQQALGGWLASHGIQIIFAKPGIVMALLFVTYPFVIRTVQPVLMEINQSQEEAAWTLGASPWRCFVEIILPALRPAILSGALLSFARALGEFGSVVIVAGNIPRSTLTAPVYIFGQIESQNQRGASAISLVLLALSFSLMLFVDWMQSRKDTGDALISSGPRNRIGRPKGREWALVAIVILYAAVLLAGPILAIAWGALASGVRIMLQALSTSEALSAMRLTFLISISATCVNTIFGMIIAMVLARDEFRGRRVLNGLVDLPFAVSPVIGGFMLLLLFGRNGWFTSIIDALNVRVVFAPPGLLLATLFVSLPFVVRELLPVLLQAGITQEHVAYTMGASHWRAFWEITLPTLRHGLLYGVSLTFARAIGEFGAVLVVGGGITKLTETSTLFIFRALDDRNEVGAYAMALVLALASFTILLLMEFARKREQQQSTKLH